MVISMDPLTADGLFDRYDPLTGCVHPAGTEAPTPCAATDARSEHAGGPVFIWQCRSCGFEPEWTAPHVPGPPATDTAPCPKCHQRAWERFVRPGSLLARALCKPATPI